MTAATHVVVDLRDGMVFYRTADGDLFDTVAADRFAEHRNAGEPRRYRVYGLLPASAYDALSELLAAMLSWRDSGLAISLGRPEQQQRAPDWYPQAPSHARTDTPAHVCDWPQQAAEVATIVALGVRALIEQESPPGADPKANEAWIQAAYALAFAHCHDHKVPHDDRSAGVSAKNHVHRVLSWLQIAPPFAETNATGHVLSERSMLAALADQLGAVYPTDDTPAGSLDDLDLLPFGDRIRRTEEPG